MAPKSKVPAAPKQAAPPPAKAAPAKSASPAKAAPPPQEKVVNPPPRSTPAPVVETSELAVAAKPSSMALANSAPAWLQQKMNGQEARGLEKVDRDDLLIPRLVLCQDLTPAVKERRANVGDIIDNLTGEVLAEAGQPLEFIPVVLAKVRMFLTPLSEGGGIECRANDSITASPGGKGVDQGGNPTTDCNSCVHKEWDDSKEGDDAKPGCTQFYNILGLLPSRGYTPYVLSMKSTGVKVARRLLSTARQTGADFFAQKYSIFSVDARAQNFQFKNYDFKVLGWVDPQEYAAGEKFYASINGKTWSADTSDLEQEGTAPADAPDDGGEFPPREAEEGEVVEAAAPAPAQAAGQEEDAF